MYNCSPVGLRGRQLKIVAGNPPKGELFHGLERADFLVLEPVPKLSFARLPFCSTFHTHTHTHTYTHTHTHISTSECEVHQTTVVMQRQEVPRAGLISSDSYVNSAVPNVRCALTDYERVNGLVVSRQC
jgi:hypothetical protein